MGKGSVMVNWTAKLKDFVQESRLSEKSNLTIGLVAAVIVLIFTSLGAIGTFAFGVWQSGRWVGEINKSLDSILLDIKIVKNDQTELKMKWESHEARITKIEIAGSPLTQKLSEQMSAIQRSLDAHMAQTDKFMKGNP